MEPEMPLPEFTEERVSLAVSRLNRVFCGDTPASVYMPNLPAHSDTYAQLFGSAFAHLEIENLMREDIYVLAVTYLRSIVWTSGESHSHVDYLPPSYGS